VRGLGRSAALLAVCALASPRARADAGALSLSLGGGGALVSVRAPYATDSSQTGTAWSTSLQLTYSLTNQVELGVQGFFEPPAQFVHSNATIANDAGTFRGSLAERTSRIGAALRVRRVFGLVWQPFVSLDAGWSHRTFSRLDLFDVSGGTARSFGLQLPDSAQDAFLLAPAIGLRWSDDHLAVGVEPRVELLIGSPTAWSVVVPLTVSWSWYL